MLYSHLQRVTLFLRRKSGDEERQMAHRRRISAQHLGVASIAIAASPQAWDEIHLKKKRWMEKGQSLQPGKRAEPTCCCILVVWPWESVVLSPRILLFIKTTTQESIQTLEACLILSRQSRYLSCGFTADNTIARGSPHSTDRQHKNVWNIFLDTLFLDDLVKSWRQLQGEKLSTQAVLAR